MDGWDTGSACGELSLLYGSPSDEHVKKSMRGSKNKRQRPVCAIHVWAVWSVLAVFSTAPGTRGRFHEGCVSA